MTLGTTIGHHHDGRLALITIGADVASSAVGLNAPATVHAVVVLDLWQGDKILLCHRAKLGEATVTAIGFRSVDSYITVVLIVLLFRLRWWFA